MVNSKKSIEDIRQIIKKAFDDSKGHNNLIGFISQKNDQERLKRRRGLRSVHSKDELFIEMSHDLSLDQLQIHDIFDLQLDVIPQSLRDIENGYEISVLQDTIEDIYVLGEIEENLYYLLPFLITIFYKENMINKLNRIFDYNYHFL